MRKLALLSLFLAVGAAADTPFDPSYSIVRMHVKDMGHCTAFAISPFRYATAAHCVLDDIGFPIQSAQLEDRWGRTWTVTPSYIGYNHDVAILSARGMVKGIIPLTLSKRRPKVGDRLTVIGNGLNQGWLMESGTVKSIQTDDILLDMRCVGGFSGAPVFNTRGEVVGVLSYGLISRHDLTSYCGVRRISHLEGR